MVFFLFFVFSGSAFCEPQDKGPSAKKNSESVISDDETEEEGETIPLLDLDGPEAPYFEKGEGYLEDEFIDQEDAHPFIDSETEEEKNQKEEEERDRIIL